MRLPSDFILKVFFLLYYFSLKEGLTVIFRCFDRRQHHFEQRTQCDVAAGIERGEVDRDVLTKREGKDM